jgi:protein TonB
MVFTNALPVNSLKGLVFLPPVPTRGSAPKPPDVRHTHQNTSNFVNNELQAPREVPRYTHHIVDTQQPDSSGDYMGPGIEGAIPGLSTQRGTAITSLLNGIPQPVQPHNIVPSKPIILSRGITEGLLIHKVTPEYPSIARQGRIQGQVLLQAVIGRDGTIQNLQLISGHPMLVKSALDAVRQWRYRPYRLNDQPVEVETQITVNFVLGG